MIANRFKILLITSEKEMKSMQNIYEKKKHPLWAYLKVLYFKVLF